jgi:hypothetical protein
VRCVWAEADRAREILAGLADGPRS